LFGESITCIPEDEDEYVNEISSKVMLLEVWSPVMTTRCGDVQLPVGEWRW